ncbi:hypothetical protein AX15_003004 [Amanita polypyramis BW_CC]|nr:hypothetical protein AX15_003004 [Amanita polypyramis BW_CC]
MPSTFHCGLNCCGGMDSLKYKRYRPSGTFSSNTRPSKTMPTNEEYCHWLHNFVRSQGLRKPEYLDKWNGRLWTSIVKVEEIEYGSGTGNDKTAARREAARVALNVFRVKYKMQ